MKHILAVTVLALGAQAAGAQIIDSGRGGGRATRAPEAWTSLSIGWLQHQGLCDAETGDCWDFGSAPQWRASLEFPMGRSGATLGAVATTAKIPLTYVGGVCGTCDADANASQFLGNLRIGGGAGPHQVIDINAGIAVFSNFRATGGTALGGKAKTYPAFSIGYGFALPLRPKFQITLLQEYGLVIGKRVSGRSSNSAQTSTTRLGVRLGLGG